MTAGEVAPALWGIPVVSGSSERAALFPAPSTDQRVFNKTTGSIERWTGTAWIADFGAFATGLVSVKSVPYLAAGDGVTLDTTAIQSALTAMLSQGVTYFPATPNASYYKVNLALTRPRLNGLCLVGDGWENSQIRQTDPTKIILDSNGTWSSPTNRHVIKQLALVGGLDGVNLNATHRALLRDLYISGAARAGIYCTDSLLLTGEHFMLDGCYDGMYVVNGGHSGLNGGHLTNFLIENSTRYGIYFVDGATGLSIVGTIENCLAGGIIMGQSADDIHIEGGTYFEQNTDTINPSADIYVGSTSYCGAIIEGCIFNGRNVGASYDYTPLRIKFGSGIAFHRNTLNVGNRLVVFEAGGTVLNSRFGPTKFLSGTVLTDPSALYKNLPPAFVTNGNSIDEPLIVPLGPGSYITEDLPYGWTTSFGTGSSLARSPNTGTVATSYRGRKTCGLLTRGTGVCQISKVISIDAVNNGELRNRFVTFAIPLLCTTNAAADVQIDVAPNGTGAATATVHASPLNLSDGWKIYYCSGFVPSDATTITLIITPQGTSTAFYLGKPEFYMGVAPVPGDDEGAGNGIAVYRDTVAPTAGTWEVGDRVINSTPALGGPIAWVCRVAGTPGTWIAENWEQGSFGDNGDANVVLVATSTPTIRFDTALTVNRTVTLPTRAAAYPGQKFRIVRTGLGAFTLAVNEDAGDGGTTLKTMPSATAAFVDVEFENGATAKWQLTGYGAL